VIFIKRKKEKNAQSPVAPLVVGPSTLPLPPVSSYGPPHRYMAFRLFDWPITSSIGSPRHRWACYVAASTGHCVVDSPVVACSVVDWPTVSSMGHGVLTMDPSCHRSGAVLFIGPWSCRLRCRRVDSPTVSRLGAHQFIGPLSCRLGPPCRRCVVDWAPSCSLGRCLVSSYRRGCPNGGAGCFVSLRTARVVMWCPNP